MCRRAGPPVPAVPVSLLPACPRWCPRVPSPRAVAAPRACPGRRLRRCRRRPSAVPSRSAARAARPCPQRIAIVGVTQKRWGPDGQRTCTGLQRESGVGGKSSPTKESLPSQNTTLISPVIIAQIDEDKSKGNHPSVPMQPLVPHPRACPSEPSVPSRGSAIVTRAFLVLPSGLEIQASLADPMSPSDSPSPAQGPKQQRGFASITVTARRVSVGSGDLARGPGAGQEPSTASPTSSRVSAVLGRWPPPAHANQQPSPTKVSKSCSKLGEEPQKQLFEPGIEEDGVGLHCSDGREKVPPSFTSRVQLQVSQRCPSAIYYLDKSLSVCLDQPRVKCQKMYRSTLSFRLKCSLSGLTADGVDGIANGEPMEERAPRKLPGARRAPLRPHLSADCAQKEMMNKEKSKEGYLGRKRPLQSVFASGLPACVDIPRGAHKAAAAKEEHEQPGSLHSVLSIQIPYPSTEAGTPVLVGSRRRSSTTASGSLPDAASREAVAAAAADGSSKRTDPSKDTSKTKEIQAQGVLKPKMSVSNSLRSIKASSRILREENVHRQKQLLKSDCEFRGSRDRAEELEAQDGRERGRRVALARVTLARVTLARAHPPGVAWERMALSWPESSSQLEKTPAAPWTLREALELHNPQFISRSQKRLRRLQLMAQLRRAQQREAPPSTPAALARKLSSTSTASRKKQFTIPDPLSDNLFKPKERVIPEKEMHMRSKRIYDNLPEVKKKQEEKQKRIIIQSNRLRVEMFKKQLLDQLLHRNTE